MQAQVMLKESDLHSHREIEQKQLKYTNLTKMILAKNI